MAETALNYSEILAHFTEETIADRYRFLYDKMQEYIKERKQEDCLKVDEDILQQTIMDYFTDIYRLKIFHNIEHANKSKILSYEIYWILKRKPLQVQTLAGDVNPSDRKRSLVFANEGFAITLLANELLIPKEQIPMEQEKEAVFLELLDQLYYHFKYRLIDKQNLEVILCAFEAGKALGR